MLLFPWLAELVWLYVRRHAAVMSSLQYIQGRGRLGYARGAEDHPICGFQSCSFGLRY